tara:strand:- start:531 stop:845 length:315 start_codon:yes stop_codon:yes gene_type:complete
MQLYVINWSFQNNEDQLFATNEFCQYLNDGKLKENIDGFELKCIAHIPQNGSGVIICKASDISILFRIFNMWRKNFNISFEFKPALTNEELASTHIENSFWVKN